MTPLSHLIYQDTINKYEITKFKFISLICNVSNQMHEQSITVHPSIMHLQVVVAMTCNIRHAYLSQVCILE